MILFVDKIFSLLTIPPGNLAYHLVVVFAIAAALQAGARFWPHKDLQFGRRLVGGLFLLLGLQFVSFLGAAVAWLGVVESHTLLPPLDRLIYIFSLLLIVWMWLFPESKRSGDIAILLLALFVVTGFALSLVWWSGQESVMTFNGTWPDQAGHIFSILLLIGTLAALVLTRPTGWGVGVAVFLALFFGHVLALLFDPYEQDYSGSVRLAQMAAYPWLIYLSFRFAGLVERQTPPPAEVPDRRRYSINPNVLHDFIDLATLEDPEKLYKILPQTVARLMVADLCMLVTAPEPNGQMSFPFGYNLIEEKPIDGFTIDARLAPGITNTMLRSRSLRLPASSATPDLAVLARFLRLQRQGSMLVVPLPGEDERASVGLLLISPFSNRSWSAEDQTLLEKLGVYIARRLNNILKPAVVESKPALSESQVQEAQKFLTRISEDNKRLTAQLEQLQTQFAQEKSRAESLAALIARQEDLNRQHEAELLAARAPKTPPGVPVEEFKAVQAELALAQQQIAELGVMLAKAEEFSAQPVVLPAQAEQLIPSETIPAEHVAEIVTLTQELRQPLTSITGYTDMLLGESMGILGTLQRKFLERIKSSVERITTVIDDLVQATSLAEKSFHPSLANIDLNAVIDEAIAGAVMPFREKNLLLRVDVPDDLPGFRADQSALEQVIRLLLQNAGVTSPAESEITLRARAEIKTHEPGYMLIQVSDSGGGIPSEELPRLFSPSQASRQEKIAGIGVSAEDLASVKMLVEAHRGRVWVDSVMGQGSTFSALFPLADEGLGVR